MPRSRRRRARSCGATLGAVNPIERLLPRLLPPRPTQLVPPHRCWSTGSPRESGRGFVAKSPGELAELVALNVEDLEFDAARGPLVTIRRSKTDQDQAGATVAVPYARAGNELCAVRTLRAYLEAAGIHRGPVFRRLRRGDTLTDQRALRSVGRADRQAPRPRGRRPRRRALRPLAARRVRDRRCRRGRRGAQDRQRHPPQEPRRPAPATSAPATGVRRRRRRALTPSPPGLGWSHTFLRRPRGPAGPRVLLSGGAPPRASAPTTASRPTTGRCRCQESAAPGSAWTAGGAVAC
jgi:hypothetical protein